MHGRADGFTLIEALAALTLTALLATAVVATALAQLRLARAVALRAASADAVRTTSWVLSGEARRGHARDVRGWSTDSIALRAFRGRGIVCGSAGNRLVVRYTGDRLPDATKDSVLTAGEELERAAAVLGAADVTGPCAARSGERLLRLDLDRPLAGAPLILVFESGSYHIAARAFRYRSGAEGRQPITAEVFRGRSGFVTVTDATIRYALDPDSMRTLVRSASFPVTPLAR